MRKMGMAYHYKLLAALFATFLVFSGGAAWASSRLYLPLLLNNSGAEPTTPVAFTFTTTPARINTLPPGADSLEVTFNGKTIQSGTSPITFAAPGGAYTFTARALSGASILSAMGPIPLTVAAGYSLTVPLAFSFFPGFDNYQTDVGVAGPNTLIYFGTTGNDRVVQHGGPMDDLLSADCSAGNDWIEQYGGSGDDTINCTGGIDNNYIYQEGGDGK